MDDSFSAPFDDLESIHRIVEAHGFCLVKNVFSPAQMETFENGLAADYEAFDGHLPEVMSCPSVRDVALDQKVLDIARQIMTGPLYYYGESHLDFEREIGPRSLSPFSKPHFDARGSRESLDPFWSSPTDEIFRCYRFAVYFRDYKHHSGGLLVGVGSHRGDLKRYGVGAPAKASFKHLKIGEQSFEIALPETPLYIVPSEPGDLVIWNLRTLHSAGARRLAAKPGLILLPDFEDKIYQKRPDVFLPPPGPRNAIFFDYGTASEEVDLYIKHRSLKATPDRLEHWKNWSYDDDEAQSLLKNEGIHLRFDPLIANLCMRIDQLRKSGAPESECQPLRERLLPMLEQHTEFSPYFSLFEKDTYVGQKAQSERAAMDYAIDAVLARIGEVTASTKPG